MSEEQIATALGQIMGELRSLREEFARYLDDHSQRHEKLDTKIDDHEAHINQQRGAKAMLLITATTLSTLIAGVVSFFTRKI